MAVITLTATLLTRKLGCFALVGLEHHAGIAALLLCFSSHPEFIPHAQLLMCSPSDIDVVTDW